VKIGVSFRVTVEMDLCASLIGFRVLVLLKERDAPVTQDGELLTVTMPSNRDHEVVAIDS